MKSEDTMSDKVDKTDEQWQQELTPEQYEVLRQKGTERAFTGKYWDHKETGAYRCAGCGQELFSSETKYDSHCGWPSFTAPATEGHVEEEVDVSHGMKRTEVLRIHRIRWPKGEWQLMDRWSVARRYPHPLLCRCR